MLLKDKKILVCVTGSIAIYKALELIRLYIKAGAKVRVIMTDGAKKFINPITFEAISQNKVLDESNENWDKSQDYNHIDIGKWADVLVLAPCTANTINKIANGIADNLLTQTILAFSKTIILAPAANTNMILNAITKNSLDKLKSLNYQIIASQTKELVCKDVGDGAMAEPEQIFYASAREILKQNYWVNRDVVLSGGGTSEKIDDVRYISNFSSGKMASSLAKALYLKGANVTLVSTRGFENLPNNIEIKKVESSIQMFESLQTSLKNLRDKEIKPYLFMVAAVSDYIVQDTNEGKLKKEFLGENWDLKLKQNIDILSSLDKEDIYSIGFKAETDEVRALYNASSMLEKKSLDAVCLNILGSENNFGSNTNEIELLLKNNSYSFKGEKLDVSFGILNKLQEEFEKNE